MWVASLEPDVGVKCRAAKCGCVRLNEGMTGQVILDEFGDREPDYWITDMVSDGSFVKISEVVNLDLEKRVSWSNTRGLIVIKNKKKTYGGQTDHRVFAAFAAKKFYLVF